MEDSRFSRRRSHSHYKAMRGNPEGDSYAQKQKFRVPAQPRHGSNTSTDSGVSSVKRRKQIRYDDYHGPEKKKKHRRTYSDSDLSTLDTTDTPDSLSQISAIAPVSELSIDQANFSRSKPAKFHPDTTWENAVSHARGEPDGAEKSFHKKKSKLSVNEMLAPVPEDASLHNSNSRPSSQNVSEQENIPEVANAPNTVERKKSIKVQLRKAASVLKKAKSKSKLPDSKTGAKKRLDATLADETMTKKPSMKELTKKERKTVRKTMKSNFEQIKRSKKIWEELRRQNTTKDRKNELCTELLSFVRGKMKEFCFAHDTARVIQCLIQFGSPEQRDIVFEELKDEITTMAKSKYAKFLVKKLLMYGTKHHRSCIYKSFHHNVRKLIRHREASDVIEYAYNEYANASQRLSLLEDFYGPSFQLFKTPDIKCLGQIMLSQPDKRDMILRNMKEALLPLIDKTILGHTMVHKVFLEFFTYAELKMKAEMIEALRESLVHMLHTRDGSRVAMQCVWHGTAKDRKVIIKSLKTHVEKACKEEYGHMVILSIFDCVDDTKIVKNIVLEYNYIIELACMIQMIGTKAKEILKSLSEMVDNQYGRKVLLYLLSPRDPLHFHPDVVRVLAEGDHNLSSKKDKALRYRELLDVVSSPLLQYIVDHASDLVVNNNTLLLMVAIITHTNGDPTAAMEAVAKIAAEPFVAGSIENMHIVENPAGHMTLKRLIQNDQDRIKAGNKVLFSEVLLKSLPEGSLKSWAACNRGCFTLVFLLDLGHPEVTKSVVIQLKGVKHSLRKMIFKGAQLLLQKLENVT